MHKLYFFISLPLLTGCAPITPDLYRSIESIATDDAISIEIDRDAIGKKTDISIHIELKYAGEKDD